MLKTLLTFALLTSLTFAYSVQNNKGCIDKNGDKRQAGEKYTAQDGCEHCTCDGGGAFTCLLKECPRDEKGPFRPRTSWPADHLCTLPPPKSGNCSGKILPRWTFNKSLKKCVPIKYGGCGRNLNFFETRKGCRLTCEFEKY